MSDVLELNIKTSLTVNEVIAKASRRGFSDIVIIGRDEEGIVVIPSDMYADYCHWLLSKASHCVLENS
jgi:hypothetical protein